MVLLFFVLLSLFFRYILDEASREVQESDGDGCGYGLGFNLDLIEALMEM